MKIIYLHQYFNTPDMAGGTRSYEMARRWVEWGHDVHMITTWRRPSGVRDWYMEDVAGVKVHWLPVTYSNTMGFAARVMAFLKFAVKAGPRAVSIGGDVVFATSTPLTIAIPAIYASKRLRVPMVFEVRDLWPEIPVAMGVIRNPLIVFAARQLERLAYRSSAYVVALSEGMAEGVCRVWRRPGRVRLIPNSADLDLFISTEQGAKGFREKHPEIGEGPIVLYPGTLGRVNGVSYFVRLADAVKERLPSLRFVVIGDGVESGEVEKLASHLGVLGLNFFKYGQLPKKELVDAFSAASLVVSLVIDNPVLWANSANKFFDGLASGTAVAVNHGGWQAELLEREGAGFRLDADPENAAEELVKIFSQPGVLQAMGVRARHLAEQRFARDDLARELEKTLAAAASEGVKS